MGRTGVWYTTLKRSFGVSQASTDGAVRQRTCPAPGSPHRRNVEMLFSRKDHLKYVLMKYEISMLSCLQTIYPKKYTKNYSTAQTAGVCRLHISTAWLLIVAAADQPGDGPHSPGLGRAPGTARRDDAHRHQTHHVARLGLDAPVPKCLPATHPPRPAERTRLRL